jgi:hypothetical protein
VMTNRRIMEARSSSSSSEPGGSHSRGCCSTAKSIHRRRKVPGSSWVRCGKLTWWGGTRRRNRVMGLGLYHLPRAFSNRGGGGSSSGKGAVPPLFNCRCIFLKRRAHHTVCINIRSIELLPDVESAPSGCSEANSVSPCATVSGGSKCVFRSHSRSAGVGSGGSVHRAPSGKVRRSLNWVSSNATFTPTTGTFRSRIIW